jgi:transposase
MSRTPMDKRSIIMLLRIPLLLGIVFTTSRSTLRVPLRPQLRAPKALSLPRGNRGGNRDRSIAPIMRPAAVSGLGKIAKILGDTSNSLVASAPAQEGEWTDETVSGLILRVSKTGVKAWDAACFQHLPGYCDIAAGKVFIDESAATTKMTRLYGRAPQGERLVDKVPHGHWKTTTFICGLRYDGVTAPFVLNGPMDGPLFLAYVQQILAPTLKKGQIVFLDNVCIHKVDGVEEAIAARGACAVFLPAYSPDLNPIERKMKARTVEQLWRAIASFLKAVYKEECKAYLANSGYT